MEPTMSAGALLVLSLLFVFVAFWYGTALKRLFRPLGRMLDAGDVHAQVYASSVKNSAVVKASKLEVDAKAYAKAKKNLEAIKAFSFDDFEEELVDTQAE